jgi:ketosteroid isomerase-like protein
VENRYQEWLAAENNKDATAITNFYDENAVLMPKAEEFVLGKAAIGEYYQKLVANPNFVPFTLKLDWNSFHAVGDIAIATAMFEGDATRNGKQIHFRGKNLLVWKKQNDGSWKIFRYMFDEILAKK